MDRCQVTHETELLVSMKPMLSLIRILCRWKRRLSCLVGQSGTSISVGGFYDGTEDGHSLLVVDQIPLTYNGRAALRMVSTAALRTVCGTTAVTLDAITTAASSVVCSQPSMATSSASFPLACMK